MNSNENNNNNNNEELNVVSLGSVDNNRNLNVPINDIPPVTPIPVEENVETLDTPNIDIPINNVNNNVSEQNLNVGAEVINNGSVPVTPEVNNAQPIDINTIPTEVPPLEPVAPINYDIPEIIDSAPLYNDIGTVPPITNDPVISNAVAEPATSEKPKKKGMNKTLFVVIIILALCAVGGGVYVFLKKAEDSKPAVITKILKVERGANLSTDIKDYAIFKNIDSSTCNFDTTEITDTNTLGAEYKFRITCGTSTYIGKAIIVDTTAPDVTLREVNVAVNEEINAADFIAECKDASECSYSFKDEEKVKEYLKEVSSYHVPIIVKDEAGNEKEVTGTLNVSENVSKPSLVCTKTEDDYSLTDKFGLTGSDFNKSTTRSYAFTFKSKEEYEKVRDENKDKEEVTYLEITGKPVFDDDKMTLTLTKKVNYDDLKKEVDSEVPVPFGELKLFFEGKDYTCSLGF